MRELTPDDIALVESVARDQALRCRVPWEELQSLGWLGLLRAARTFDPSRGVDFGAWARLKIRGEIRDRLRIEWGSAQLGTKRMKLHPQFLDDLELLRTLDEKSWRPLSDQRRLELRDICDWGLKFLSEREQRVFRMRFYDSCTEQEIADYLGVTESRVCHILRRGLKLLHTHMKAEIGDAYREVKRVDEPLMEL